MGWASGKFGMVVGCEILAALTVDSSFIQKKVIMVEVVLISRQTAPKALVTYSGPFLVRNLYTTVRTLNSYVPFQM